MVILLDYMCAEWRNKFHKMESDLTYQDLTICQKKVQGYKTFSCELQHQHILDESENISHDKQDYRMEYRDIIPYMFHSVLLEVRKSGMVADW